MIDLRSDTVTLPSNEMKSFMINSQLGDDVYGEDPSINTLEHKISKLFNKEAALFVPSGTMANLVSVLSHCDRGSEVLLGDKSHIFVYEAGGISAFGGLHSHQLTNNIDGTINLDLIEKGIRNTNDDHFPNSKLLCLENTHNLCYGHPIPTEYFQSVAEIINQHNIKLHIDGARIFNASIALDTPVNKLVKNADSISCCLSKGLGCPSGSLIVGSKSFINKARKIRKGIGGGMRQAGILASAGIYAIKHMISRLHKDHKHAKILANELANINGININTDFIKTNIIFFYLAHTKLSDMEFVEKLLQHNIKIDSKGSHKFRMVTHCGINENNIEQVIDTMKVILKELN